MSTQKTLVDLYTSHYNKFGQTSAGLGWGDKDRTGIRYGIFLTRWNLEGASILDVGCGFGDFSGFLTKNNIQNFRYTGVDINPTFIRLAQKKYPSQTFSLRDIAEQPLNKRYDYVFASGLFNDKLAAAKKRTKVLLDAIAKHAKKGFAVNFLSDKVDYPLRHTNHTSPSWALDLCYSYSRNIVLRNDYMPFEFTVFVDVHEPFDKYLAVYKRFLPR